MRKVITLRLDENERAQVRAEMRAAGIKTMSRFFRTRALESPGLASETARQMTVEAAEAVREVRAIAVQAIRDAEAREARLVEIIAAAMHGATPERKPAPKATGKYAHLPEAMRLQFEAADAEEAAKGGRG